jgi:hypothetical protein
LFRIPKSEDTEIKVPIQVNDHLIFASCHYKVESAGDVYRLKLFKEANPLFDDKKAPPQELETETPEEGISVGRLKKNNFSIPHTDLSGKHCIIYKDGVVDMSSNGTFLAVRQRLGFVNVLPETTVRTAEFDIVFK